MNKDLIVLGGGSGGLATAFRAARHGARVALLEPRALGGTCVNVGCVPKKAMWYAAETAGQLQLASRYGFDVKAGSLDWPHFVALREAYIDRVHQSYDRRLAKAGIEVIPAAGRLVEPGVVDAGGQTLHAPHVLIATGGRSRRLDVTGAELAIDSDGFFDLRACPERVAIVGGGYIGVELAGVLQALGAQVELLARGPLLRAFDRELVTALAELMRGEGIGVHVDTPVPAARRDEDGIVLDGFDQPFDCLIHAAGRVPNSDRIGLDAVGVAVDDKGYVTVDRFQDTNVPGIHALGDVTGHVELTPAAIAAGRKLADRLFGGATEAHLDYRNIPSVVFSHPPLATVGLTEAEARDQFGDSVHCYTSRFKPMQWSLAGRGDMALMKLVVSGEDERVRGVHILGPGADEMMQGFAVAVKMGARKVDFDATVAIHPTSSEELVLMG